MLSISEYEQAVWDQWLLSDLRELSYSYLPPDMLKHSKLELNGVYFLQVSIVLFFKLFVLFCHLQLSIY